MLKNNQHISSLDTLRLLAILNSVTFHASVFGLYPLLSSNIINYQVISIFFLLSGFILAYKYPYLSIRDLWPFMVARFARIWPAYIAALIIAIPITFYFYKINIIQMFHYPFRDILLTQIFCVQT